MMISWIIYQLMWYDFRDYPYHIAKLLSNTTVKWTWQEMLAQTQLEWPNGKTKR